MQVSGWAHSPLCSDLIWFGNLKHNGRRLSISKPAIWVRWGGSNHGSVSVLAVYTLSQQLQIVSQNFCQLTWHMSKHPPPLFAVSKPTWLAVRCTWLCVLCHCFISRHDFFSPEKTAVGYILAHRYAFAALKSQKNRSYLPVVFVSPAMI